MVDNFYENLKSIWKRIRASKSGTIRLNDIDRKTLKEAFKKAWYHEDLFLRIEELKIFEDRWNKAIKLFHDKHANESDYDYALREAAVILEIDKDAHKKGKRKRLHPTKDEELIKDYEISVDFGDAEGDPRKEAINLLYQRYNFSSPERLSRYLRENLGLKNIPSMINHNKNIK